MTPRETIQAIRVALVEERKAIGKLDAGRLAELALEKQSLIQALENAAPEWKNGADKKTRHEITNMYADADANRMLLSEAIDTIAEILGLKGIEPTYDARARLKTAVHPVARRGL